VGKYERLNKEWDRKFRNIWNKESKEIMTIFNSLSMADPIVDLYFPFHTIVLFTYLAQRLRPSHVIPQLKQRNDAYSELLRFRSIESGLPYSYERTACHGRDFLLGVKFSPNV
jgi:hypothetical protein